jgi:poly-beta-1,6-N-acetyl-D-glucosamine N-deacetylase
VKRLNVTRWHLLFILVISILVCIFEFGNRQFKNQSYSEHIAKPVNAHQLQNFTRDLGYDDQIVTRRTIQVKLQTNNNITNNNITNNNMNKIFYQNKVAVLTYHHLDPVESSVTITPERFKSHLETLKNNGFHVISMEDFVGFLQKKNTVPPNAVVITFDDGYESVYKYAYPILKSEGMTATVFLIVSFIEDGSASQPSILNWKEIMEMHNDRFSFYSHSYNSHNSVVLKGKELAPLVDRLFNQSANRLETNNEYKTRIRSDIIKADSILNSKLGNKINLLCFPFGLFNRTVIDIANQSGIPFLFTGIEGFNTNKDKLIKRINVGSPYMSDKLLIYKISR